MDWPGAQAVITSLAASNRNGKVARVELLGGKGDLEFSEEAAGLRVVMPSAQPCKYAFVLKITGLKL